MSRTANRAERPRQRRGRPPWRPPDLDQVEALASRGLTFNQIALALGIDRATLFRKRRQLRGFNDALKRGRAKCIAAVAGALYEKACQGNLRAIIFYLKARANWRDSGPVETNKADIPRAEPYNSLELMRALTREERQQLSQLIAVGRRRLANKI